MEAFCLGVSLRPPTAFVFTEISEQLGMDFASSQRLDDRQKLSRTPEEQPPSADFIYQVLASKKPRGKPATSRKRKHEETGHKRSTAVLVVDDVADVTEMIQLLLKHAGYDVSTADSAKAALRLAQKRQYDLVISDIGMPEMNGYELATALRSLTDYNATPLIAVTGYSEYDDRGRAVSAGFDVHLTKPIEPNQLLNLMSQLLSQSEQGTNH